MRNLNSTLLRMTFKALMLVLALSNSSLFAQNQHTHDEKCGHVAVLSQLRQEDPQVDARIADMKRQVNQWIAENPNGASNRAVVTIPVHVIIVHNGEAVGTGRNLSAAQIQSQIDVLNEDFRRLNADASNTPSAFVGVAADCEIEFCLASIDDQGNPTNGITRYQHSSGTVSNSALENTIKPATSWGNTNYLNMWSARISGGTLGYAYFPNAVPSNRDGVVIGDQYFGRPSSGFPYDGGRTATHEVGHWLALEHIWGDGNCSIDDGIADTPTSDDSYGGCPSFPQTSCGTSDMFMNYMDYVNDDCMNLFTQGQKSVMVGVLNTSRSSILTAASSVCNVSACTVTVPTGLNATNLASTSVTLNWSAVTNAASYNVRAREIGTSTWTTGTATGVSINFTGLSVCTDYEFQVEAVCSGGSPTSGYSASTNFQTTGCSSGCSTPTNLAVLNVTDSTLALGWDDVVGADSYYVDIRVFGSGGAFSTFTLGGSNVNFTGVSSCTTYEFQVAAICGTSVSSYTATDTATTAGCGGNAGCDELDNTNGGSLAIYSPGGTIWGFVSGHNGYGDAAKADYFNYSGTGDQISGAYFRFGYAAVGNAANSVTFNIWDATGTNGEPGSVIATATELTSNIATDVSNAQETYIDFGGVALPANGQFYVGFELNYNNGDTLAIITNTNGDTSPATAWEEWSGGGGWYAYDDASAWGLTIAHLIFPVVCEASSVTCTPDKDIFEPNESLAAAAELPKVGVNMNAKICDLNDEDWYAIEVDAAKPKVRIEFGGLASNDFSAELYDASGSLVASSMMTAPHEEAILYNNASAGTYYVRVYGVNGAFSDRGYYLRYTARSSNFAIREITSTIALPNPVEAASSERKDQTPTFEVFIEESFKLYPNPSTDFVTVDFSLVEQSNVQLRVLDMYGKVVEMQSIRALKGNNQQILDMSSLAKGVYFVELYTPDQKWSQKLSIIE